MASDLLQLILKGIEKGEKDSKEKERKKALSNFIQSLDVLTKGQEPPSPSPDLAPAAPAPPPIPQMAPLGPTGGPQAPIMPLPQDMTGMGPFSPAGPMGAPGGPIPAPTAPVISPMAGGGQMDRIKRGIFGAIGEAGDYAPEAVQMVHQLFGGKLFGEGGYGTVSPGGSVFSKDTGAITGTAPDKPSKPSLGVSEKGWLTFVTPDGETTEMVGVRPPKIVQEAMKGETARDVARIRGQYQLMTAEERGRAQKAVATIRTAVGDRINSPAKLYTYLTQKWIDGTANSDEIAVLQHLEPVIIKMGGLQMLMEMETGKKTNVAPWEALPEEEKPPPEAQQDYSWWQKLIGGGKAPPTPPSSGTTTPPGVPPAAAKGGGAPKSRVTMTFGTGKQYNLTPPSNYAEKDIRALLEEAERAAKKGKDPDAIVNKLRQMGWTAN